MTSCGFPKNILTTVLSLPQNFKRLYHTFDSVNGGNVGFCFYPKNEARLRRVYGMLYLVKSVRPLQWVVHGFSRKLTHFFSSKSS